MLKKYNLFHPYVSDKARKAVNKVLKSKFIGQGPKVEEFEKAFADKFGFKHVISMNSCTSALSAALALAKVGPRSEVICPILTAPATIQVVFPKGASVKFCDIKDDLTIDYDDLKSKITSNTSAIIGVHYNGTRYDKRVWTETDVPVIEDAAQAIGAENVGKMGDYSCFSFQAIKPVTTIDGGMLRVNNEDEVDLIRRARFFGFNKDKTDILGLGGKFHTNSINAAMGIEHLKELDKIKTHYWKLHKAYKKGLKDVVKFPPKKKGDTIWTEIIFTDKKDKLEKHLNKKGIEAKQVHPRLDSYTAFGPKYEMPNMDRLEDKYLNLPLHMKMTVDDVKKVCKEVKNGLTS